MEILLHFLRSRARQPIRQKRSLARGQCARYWITYRVVLDELKQILNARTHDL